MHMSSMQVQCIMRRVGNKLITTLNKQKLSLVTFPKLSFQQPNPQWIKTPREFSGERLINRHEDLQCRFPSLWN